MKKLFLAIGMWVIIQVLCLICIKYKLDILVYFMPIIVLILMVLVIIISNPKVKYKEYISLEEVPVEFETIYKELYDKYIYSLEKMRKQIKWKNIFKYFALFLSLLGYIVGSSKNVIISREIHRNIVIVGIISFIILIFLIISSDKEKRKYVKIYKEEVVQKFIKLINSKLEYKSLDYTELFKSEQYYRQANFDNKAFNRYYPDDYIEGFIDDEIFINMCDVHIQHHTGSGKNSNTEEIFQGIFVNLKCNRDIKTNIKISKNKIKILKKEDRIEMDSQEFERYFDVYSDNKIIAMQLLTSDTMEFLVDFHNKYKLNYEIVLKNNNIYMRFFTGPMFEPKILRNSMDKEILFIYFCILKFAVEIIKKVNKNLQDLEV